MLQSMRNKTKGLVAVFLIGLLTIPLALVGVENLFYGNSNVGEAAEVDGTVITERDVQLAIARERQRLQSQFGENLPADFFTDERLRESVMQSLVQRTLMVNAAEKGNMTFSEKEVDQSIIEIPIFQAEGVFDQQRFLQGVRNLGHTPASFRQLLKDDMLANQMQNAVVTSDFITDEEINLVVALSRQTRNFSWLTLPLGDLPNSMSVSEEEIQAYYDTNKQQYLSEEQVSIEYIDLSIGNIEKDIVVAEADVQQKYDEIVNSYVQTTQREAAHIMIEGDDAAAQEKIAAVEKKLAEGADFAALAAEYSDDFGTRDNGGNLGVSSGDAFPEDFEKALLTLSEGQVSAPVNIDNATHFIKLLTLNEQSAPTFDSQKAKIESELKRVQAEERFIQDTQALEELAYNAENLQEVADQLDVNLVKTAMFSRNTAAITDSLLQDNKVVNAAFSDQVVQDKHSSELLSLSADRVVVVKLLEHKPVRTLTLEEKREEIISTLQLDKAKQQVAEQAKSIREALDGGADISQVAEERQLSLSIQTDAQRNTSGVPEELLSSVFAMPSPNNEGVSLLERHLDNGDYVLVSLSKVTAGDTDNLTDAERVSLRSSLSSGMAGDEYRAWQAQLEANADVQIYRSQNASL